jgi:hypothetical protein
MDASSYARWRAPPAIVQPWVGLVRPNCFAAPGIVTYNIRVPPSEANAAPLERLWRGHWTIESQSHYVRDVTLGEDRNHMRTGRAPQALAALRNGLLALWRRAGWTNIADAVRAHAASGRMDEHRRCGAGTCGPPPRALAFISVPVTLT